MRARLLPGDGVGHVIEFVRTLDRIGCQAPIVEVFCGWLLRGDGSLGSCPSGCRRVATAAVRGCALANRRGSQRLALEDLGAPSRCSRCIKATGNPSRSRLVGASREGVSSRVSSVVAESGPENGPRDALAPADEDRCADLLRIDRSSAAQGAGGGAVVPVAGEELPAETDGDDRTGAPVPVAPPPVRVVATDHVGKPELGTPEIRARQPRCSCS